MGNAQDSSRRNVLRSIAAGSVISTAFAGRGVEAKGGLGAGADDEREIVSGHLSDGRVVTDIVSEEWYQHLQQVRELQRELSDRFASREWCVCVGRTVAETEDEVGGTKKCKVEVKVDDVQRAQNAVPERVRDLPRDIPIEVKKRSEEKIRITDNHYDDSYCNSRPRDCIHPGDGISTSFVDKNDSSGGCWERYGNVTATTVVRRDGERYLMTCRHGFVEDGYTECTTGIEDATSYAGICDHDGDRKYLGHVTFDEPGLDVALIDTDYDVSNEIRSLGYPIEGYATEDGVDTMRENNTSVYKYGSRTCYTIGQVLDIERYSECGTTNDWVTLSTMAAGGDSGAPHYAIRREYSDNPSLLIGHHIRHTIEGGEHVMSLAPAAYELARKYDVYPASYNSCDS